MKANRTGRDADPRRTIPLQSAQWQRLRASVLASAPLCRHCTEEGRTMAATDVDHRDGNPGNNRAENLRPATRLQNQHNRRVNARSKTGVKNVTPHQGKWQVRFSVARKTHHFGCYNTLEEAAAVAAKIRFDLHGEFARHA